MFQRGEVNSTGLFRECLSVFLFGEKEKVKSTGQNHSVSTPFERIGTVFFPKTIKHKKLQDTFLAHHFSPNVNPHDTAKCQGASARNSNLETGTLDPVHRNNPFAEVTNLFCRLPSSTALCGPEGCEPWRPWCGYGCEPVRLPFNGSWKRIGHLE